MKKVLFIISIISIAVLSCTKTDINTDRQKVALSVSAGIFVDQPTKSIIAGTTFADGSSIGVQIRKNGQLFYQAGTSTNVQYTYTSAAWSTLNPFYLTNTLGEVYAYYPYVSVGDNKAPFSTIPVVIDATATTGTETDYMYATPLTGASSVSNAAGNNDAALVMNHSFAQVSFYVFKNNYPGTGTFTQFKIEDAAATTFIKTSSVALTMDITNGTLAGGAKGIITRTLTSPVVLTTVAPGGDISVLKGQVNATTLVIPTAAFAVGDIKFTFTVDGVTYSATNTTGISWLSGKQYIYRAELDGTGLVILSAIITDWTSEPGDLINIK